MGVEIWVVWLDWGIIVRVRFERGLVGVFNWFVVVGINIVFFEIINVGYMIYFSNVVLR